MEPRNPRDPRDPRDLDTFARDHLPPPDQWPELRFDLPELRYLERLDCAAELLSQAPPDRPVFRTASGDTWTYGELRTRVDRIAHLLTSGLGVAPGNRGLLRGPTTPWLAACWLAVLCGEPVPDGAPGLLAVRGPVGCRYLADPRQREHVRHGWNITGDIYVRDPDGCFRYAARADGMIISAGYNIAGPEVEDALLRHPDVIETAVVGRPDASRGQIVVAYAVLRPGARRDPEALGAFVRSEPAPYKCPREIVLLDALPRTATGKPQRFRLRADVNPARTEGDSVRTESDPLPSESDSAGR